jgi:hypothetical protein
MTSPISLDNYKMAKFLVCAVGVFIFFIGLSSHATSFGYKGSADLRSINGAPAVCLHKDAEKAISVGRISMSESYVSNPGSWGVRPKPGVEPMPLQPGACLEFGIVPEGYELTVYELTKPPLNLEVNRTYVFSLRDAYHTKDDYTAVFCVVKTPEGALRYLQYTRLNDGREIVPSCGAKRNRSAPSN